MKVWVIKDHYEEIHLLAGDKDPLKDDYIKDELSYLADGYEDELNDFIQDVKSITSKGYGSAAIEERFEISLQEVG